jgi:hypothetical protein
MTASVLRPMSIPGSETSTITKTASSASAAIDPSTTASTSGLSSSRLSGLALDQEKTCEGGKTEDHEQDDCRENLAVDVFV